MSAPRVAEPKYEAVHARLCRDLGNARDHLCGCGEQAAEWAYDHEDKDERVDDRGRPYSLDPEHYVPMCVACHRKKDAGETCRKGHPYTSGSTYEYRGYRLCRTCRRENMQALRQRRTQREMEKA